MKRYAVCLQTESDDEFKLEIISAHDEVDAVCQHSSLPLCAEVEEIKKELDLEFSRKGINSVRSVLGDYDCMAAIELINDKEEL